MHYLSQKKVWAQFFDLEKCFKISYVYVKKKTKYVVFFRATLSFTLIDICMFLAILILCFATCQVSFCCFILEPLSILAAYFLLETIEQKSFWTAVSFEIQKSYTVYGSWKEYRMVREVGWLFLERIVLYVPSMVEIRTERRICLSTSSY